MKELLDRAGYAPRERVQAHRALRDRRDHRLVGGAQLHRDDASRPCQARRYILLLFIYLKLGAMVGIYFKTERLPVLFLLYIPITAMTRFLAVDVEFAVENLVVVTASIIGLALAVLVLQIAGSKFATARAEATKVL